MASGMMPLIDIQSFGVPGATYSYGTTGGLTSTQGKVLATVVIAPYVIASGAVVPGTTYFSLARKGRWAINQLMRPRVVMSINAAVERQELASMIRGEPQTISIRPHLVVFRSTWWTRWSGFGGVPMLFPWFDIHPKDQKSKSSPAARSGNAEGPGGGTKKRVTYTGQSGRPTNGNVSIKDRSGRRLRGDGTYTSAKRGRCKTYYRNYYGKKVRCTKFIGHSGAHTF